MHITAFSVSSVGCSVPRLLDFGYSTGMGQLLRAIVPTLHQHHPESHRPPKPNN
ncbi:hypothetical protein DACRYDRAFT_24889 [Dacryopinax primogenitus]|uniref:Uncharacterized protein n=1 Tax=Dacryopinax primogenitus (strain DJM 731) TaxID=1858805 RepID=M5FS63_DACPD|nr:uncharacterized protein DACRYDRAFT_24889 [Dacryopinax primogenitus]EJT97984.1 hypothetical protein DACRYDRAFT_24889 [Dacryopinax primogenitus]